LRIAAKPVPADPEDDLSGRIAALRTEARAYEHGEGVARDAQQAIALYCQASRLGDAEAQFSLDGCTPTAAESRATTGWRRCSSARRHARPRIREEDARFRRTRCRGTRRCACATRLRRRSRIVATWEPDEEFVAATPEQKAGRGRRRQARARVSGEPDVRARIIRAESNFDPNARSPKNAQGLMQLIPETSARFNVKKAYRPRAEHPRRPGVPALAARAYFKGDVTARRRGVQRGRRRGLEKFGGVPRTQRRRANVQRSKTLFPQGSSPRTERDLSPESHRPRSCGIPHVYTRS
jgi:hypothetical protein